MAKIKNMGTATMKFSEGIIVTGSAGSDIPALVVTGSIAVSGSIQHGGGDSDTFIDFQDDLLDIQVGNKQMIKLSQAGTNKIILNNGQADVDLQVKSKGNANVFRIDAYNDSVYFGSNSPAGDDNSFWVSGSIGSQGGSSRGTAVFGGDLVVSGGLNSAGNVGIGTTNPGYNLHVASAAASVVLIDGASNRDAFLRFGQAGTLKSYIKQGSAGHLVMTNETSDKDIIFNIKDGATSREGLRLNGNVAEVVVNQGGDSLVDFRVESDNHTHMLFVDGSSDNVGVGTDAPVTTLHIKGDPGQFRVEDTTVDYAYTVDCDGDGIRTHFGDMTDGESGEDAFMSFGAYSGINQLDTASRDFHIYGTNTTVGFYFNESSGSFGIAKSTPGSTLDINGSVSLKVNGLKISNYTIAADDHTVIASCGSGNVTLTLPSATTAIAGRIYVIKRTDTSNHGINTLTIDPAGSNIDGAGSDKIMAHLDALVLQCVGDAGWILIGSYMAPI